MIICFFILEDFMKRSKILAAVLVFLLFAGCGSSKNDNQHENQDLTDTETEEDADTVDIEPADADSDGDSDSMPEPDNDNADTQPDDDADSEPADDADSTPEPNDDDADTDPTDDADSQPEPSDDDVDTESDEDSMPLKKNIAISLILPTDPNYTCFELEEEAGKDYTYCINANDKIIVSVYTKESADDEYSFDSDFNFTAEMSGMNSLDLSFMAASRPYLRIFVKVLNKNGKLKLTGAAESVKEEHTKIFLAPPGDFVRIVSNRTKPDENSLESLFQSKGSKGAAATILKDGNVYMSGGYSMDTNSIVQTASVFNMKNISRKDVTNLPKKLYDHIAAFLDDRTETGKVIVGLGTTEDETLNSSLWIFDPESDSYTPLNLDNQPMTKAKSITVDGEVYIVGGCTGTGASNAVYKISAKTGSIVTESFATLHSARCNHALADVSTVDGSGNKTVKILVIGGSTNYKPEGKETPVAGENFAELVTENASEPINIVSRDKRDDSALQNTGLISPTAVGVVMDDKEDNEMLTAIVGGYIREGENGTYSWSANKNFFVFSKNGYNSFIYDKSISPFECARPSAALLGSGRKNPIKHIAVNCGAGETDRTRTYNGQIIFTLQVKRIKDFDLGTEIFSPSAQISLMQQNQDSGNNKMIDGPVAADALGQVFLLGGKYVYQTGGYEFPENQSSYAYATLPPKPIIRVNFENPFNSPMSYRNINDKVQLSLNGTCVSDPDNQESCLEDWESKYYIRYKWEMKESPSPIVETSKLKIPDINAVEGQWIPYDSSPETPKKATFYGIVATPRKYNEANDYFNTAKCALECGNEPANNNIMNLSKYLLCRQKYCEEKRTKYYKINIQAETVDKETGLASNTTDISVIPKIIPQARVVAQLTWKQGFKKAAETYSSLYEGSAIDLNLHLVKRISLEAASNNKMTIKEGVLGTKQRRNNNFCESSDPDCEVYWRHDDCSFEDQGHPDSYVSSEGTIQWHASLDIDNYWGGSNYQNPETIGLGPIGTPDAEIINDQYLIVAGYTSCSSKYNDGINRCNPDYTGEDSTYEVDARVEIFVDGEEVPRSGTSDIYAATTKDFKIKLNEWKTIAVVKWDSGNTIVTDSKIEEEGIDIDPVNHPVCIFSNSNALLIPIWDADTYRSYITTPNPNVLGSCY